MDIYKNKYLKYKQKYINLKNQLGGSIQDELNKCANKHFDKFAYEIEELIKKGQNATRELSLEQVDEKNKIKLFNERDEYLIFRKLLSNIDYENNFDDIIGSRRPFKGLNELNKIYDLKLSKYDVQNYALMDYGKNKEGNTIKKVIPYFGSFCYGPSVGIIELYKEQTEIKQPEDVQSDKNIFIKNYNKIIPGNLVRIWGTLDKSGTIGHVVLEITTSDNMRISLGVGYYGNQDDIKFEKLEQSKYGIIQLLSNVLHRKNAVIYSPDYIFNMKAYYQYNYPNRQYLKLLSQSILTKEEHSELFKMLDKINPEKNLEYIAINESEYDFTKRYNLSSDDYYILRDQYLREFYNDDAYKSQLEKTHDSRTINELKELKEFESIKQQNDLVEKLGGILLNNGKIIEQYWEKFLSYNENNIKPEYPYTKIFTYYLSYYWKLDDVDYCTITGYVADKYSKSKERKPVINCTKFVTDFFQPRIIDCKRFASGIIDPSTCKPNLKTEQTKCDVEDVPNDYIEKLNSA
jgi:hypothetical protein